MALMGTSGLIWSSYPSSLLGLSLTGICALKLLITREAESQEEVLLMLEGGAAGRVKGLALETLWAYRGHRQG